MEAENQAAASSLPTITDSRRQPRFKLESDIRIYSRTCGLLNGNTVDISELGISAVLRFCEVPAGEIVELDFALPSGPVKILATVRQRDAFRYGFEFVYSASALEVIRRTCHDLAAKQSLFGKP